jgi:radical SAM protein with 4Fe4S-binding SPASM domain
LFVVLGTCNTTADATKEQVTYTSIHYNNMSVTDVNNSLTEQELEDPRIRFLSWELKQLFTAGGSKDPTTLQLLGTKFYQRETFREERRVALVVEDEMEKRRLAKKKKKHNNNTNGKEEDGDDDGDFDTCPICMEKMAEVTFNDPENPERGRQLCCGGEMCVSCHEKEKAARTTATNYNCSLCQQEFPSNDNEKFMTGLLQKHVDKGAAWAQFDMATKHLNAHAQCAGPGPGGSSKVGDDLALLGFRLMAMAAADGYKFAQTGMGTLYQVKKNFKLARKWYLAAAEQGHALAQLEMGKFNMLGMGGEAKNEAEAIRWITLSAAQAVPVQNSYSSAAQARAAQNCYGSQQSMIMLGQAFHFGNTSVLMKNYDRSIYWDSKTAALGNPVGYARLSNSLLYGPSRWFQGFDHKVTGNSPLPLCMRLAQFSSTVTSKPTGDTKDAHAHAHATQMARQNIQKNLEPKIKYNCASCGKRDDSGKLLKTCSRCKAAYYCGATCQKRHWTAGHKVDCSHHWMMPLLDAKILEALQLPQQKQPPAAAASSLPIQQQQQPPTSLPIQQQQQQQQTPITTASRPVYSYDASEDMFGFNGLN